MKRALVGLWLLFFLPVAGQAENYAYTTNLDNTITITKYTGLGGAITTPSSIIGLPVTCIGNGAFSGCTGLVSVIIPDSVTNIGSSAFYSCEELTNVVVSANLAVIAPQTFSYCMSLPSITIPAGVADIGLEAFYCCTSLTNVVIPDSVTGIGFSAFDSCYRLPGIVIPNSVSNIGPYAFYYCKSLSSVTVPSGVAKIGNHAFGFCTNLSAITVDSLNDFYSSTNGVFFDKDKTTLIQCPPLKSGSYSVPGSVTSIEDEAFDSCSRLTGITMPSGVTNIGDYAFYKCSGLTNAVISSNVTFIGDGAFFYCEKLSGITIPNGVTRIEYLTFSGCTNLTSVTMGNGVTNVDEQAFSYCQKLSGITFPSNLVSIGESAFRGCDKLASITLPDSVTYIGVSAFQSCIGVTNITIGRGVSSIQSRTFANCTRLMNIIIPDNVISIGDATFSGCTNLTSISIGKGVASIGSQIFSGCVSLASITVDPLNLSYCSFDGVLFDRNKTTLIFYPLQKTGSFIIPDSVTDLAPQTFYSNTNLTGITFGSGITNIGAQAFMGCTRLVNISIPGSATTLGADVFSGCTGLTNMIIPDSITALGDGAFSGCTGLRNAVIGSGLTNISDHAFDSCSSLTGIAIPDGVMRIGASAFSQCTGLTTIIIPDSMVSIGDSAFYDTSLINIAIPDSVTDIGNGAFYYCRSLVRIAFPSGMNRIGDYMCQLCTNLSSVTVPASVLQIGEYAFCGCHSLTNISFFGDAPIAGERMFFSAGGTVYYMPGTTGWGSTFGGLPALLWNPACVLTVNNGAGSGSYTNGEQVAISADDAPAGKTFDLWAGATQYVENVRASSTFITMPVQDISVTATYRNAFTYMTNGNAIGVINYTGSGATADIPAEIDGLPVTRIDAGVFSGCTNLTSITFGGGITNIGTEAFFGCTGLSGIYFKGDAPVLGVNAFYGVSNAIVYYLPGKTGWGATLGGLPAVLIDEKVPSLCVVNNGAITIIKYTGAGGTVILPETINNLPVTSIGRRAFSDCTGLTSAVIGSGVTNIGAEAFFGCAGLTNVVIPAGVTCIGEGTFSGCTGLTGVMIPDSVTAIGDFAFYSCVSLSNATIGSGVTNIGTEAFSGCISLTNVVIPVSVTCIGERAFFGCRNLINAVIGSGVTNIGTEAFSECVGLISVYFAGDAPDIGADVFGGVDHATVYRRGESGGWGSTFGGLSVTFWDPVTLCIYTISNGEITIVKYIGSGGMVIIPESINGLPVKGIGSSAFSACINLVDVVLPSGIINIGNSAFSGCSNLKGVYFNGNVPLVGESVFSGANQVLIYYLPTATGWETTFCGRSTGLGDPRVPCAYTINNGTVTVTKYTGSGGAVTIPDTIAGMPVVSIGEYAFSYCGGLTGVEMGDSVTNIDGCVFYYCTNLARVVFSENVSNIGTEAFFGCSQLTNLTIPDKLTRIRFCTFGRCSSLTGITIPNRVTTIESSAFSECSGLTNVVIPAGVITMQEGVFSGCTSLTAIRVDEQNSFYCDVNGVLFSKNLTALIQYPAGRFGSYTVSNSVTDIKAYAFYGSAHLTDISIPDSVIRIGRAAFTRCPELTEVELPGNLTVIDSSVFQYCTSLTNVAIPDNVGAIWDYAFYSCTNLHELTIPASIKTIWDSAFWQCKSLTRVYFKGNAPSLGEYVFDGAGSDATVFRLPSATGWGSTYGGLPVSLWIADSQRPTVAISYPSASMKIVTNGPVILRGTAADNGTLNKVMYQSPAGTWLRASTTNVWKSWVADYVPVTGINTVRVYGVDSIGNVSATSSVVFTYVPGAVMQVQTNGAGTVTPSHNGQMLEIGKSYTINATPGIGSAFASWTYGLGGALATNKESVTFVMRSNLLLTANFIDIQKPIISITAPTALQKVFGTIGDFIVRGTAADNLALSNVMVRINGGSFVPANAATNSLRIWLRTVTLIPGTNTVSVYSLDAAGNSSATVTVKCVYTETGALNITTNGPGKVTVAPTGPLLLNKTYTLTAAANAGAVFSGWIGDKTTTNKVITFVMTSNKTFTANFTDIQKPVVAIKAPTAALRIFGTNPVYTVKGTATDNGVITGVFCRVNGGAWMNADTTNGWKTWSIPMELIAGSNLIQAAGADSAANASAFSSVSCTYVVTGTLTVQTNGQGTVARAPAGTPEVGKLYKLTAAAKAGSGFAGWTGDVNDTNKAVSFIMTTNMTITANFTDTQKPVVAIKSPTAAQKILSTSGLFTVMGTAADNTAMSNVLVQVNGGSWTDTSTTNSWKNWSLPVTLIPGTNAILACSLDTTGNSSVIVTTRCVYTVAGTLLIQTNGQGTVTRTPAGTPEVGKLYKLTAAAKAGSGFADWTGAVNDTNKAVSFIMATNMTITANFTDIQKPTVVITYPANNAKVMTNGTVIIRGTAADNNGLDQVVYQLYTGEWTNAVTTNVWKNWTADYTPVAGLNTSRVYSVDMQGNTSTVASVIFTYIPGAVLTVQTNGQGTVTPSLNGKVLQIGSTNTMTAAPKAGYVFTNWTYGIGGSVATNAKAVKFVMTSNLVLTANFRSLLGGDALAVDLPATITADGSPADWADISRTPFSYQFADQTVTQEVATALSGNNTALLLTGCPFSTSDTVLVYFKLSLSYSAGNSRHSVDLWTSGSVLYGMVDGQVITGLDAALLDGVLEVKLPVEQVPSQVIIEEVGCGMDLGSGSLTELFKLTSPSALTP